MSYDSKTPAFPFQPVDSTGQPDEPCFGMTLRDWFAGQVMAEIARSRKEGGSWQWEMESIAHDSYAMADAMLAHRTLKTGEG